MLDLAVKKGVKSVIEVVPSKPQSLSSYMPSPLIMNVVKDVENAVRRMKDNDVRYRFVMK
jgi:hypothetical protein